MPTHRAETTWTSGKDGSGELSTKSGTVEGTFTFPTRSEDELGSNSGELVGTVHSGHFSMQLTAFPESESYAPTNLHVAADVHLDPAGGDGFGIPRTGLTLGVDVPGIDEETLDDLTQHTRENCSVSKVLTGPELMLTTALA